MSIIYLLSIVRSKSMLFNFTVLFEAAEPCGVTLEYKCTTRTADKARGKASLKSS